MNPRQKVLLLSLACGHAKIVERENVARVVQGTTTICDKCTGFTMRTIKERSWVDPKKIGE